MHIKSIHLTNYRCHKDLHVEFRPGFNVLVGVNGSGKTSLLKAIADAFHPAMRAATSQVQSRDLASDIRIQKHTANGRTRFEPQYPLLINVTALSDAQTYAWTAKPHNLIVASEGNLPSVLPENKNPDPNRLANDDTRNSAGQLILFYQATRYWIGSRPSEWSAPTQRSSRKDSYANWSNASIDSDSLQTWVISKCLERFQTSSETGVLFDEIKDDELALVNAALAKSVEGIKGLYYDMKQKALVIEWMPNNGVDRDPTLFENLSDGQRSVIALVADIARRMCLLNPQLGDQVTEQTSGVILIDELDMHLHPQWQRILTKGLKAAFPAVQFIVASHSPQVLGELQPDEIILLRPEGTSHPQVSYGLDSSQVLEEIMGATARTAEVEDSLTELFASIERNDIAAARERLKKLKEQAPGIAELGGAEALIKRKELLGR